MISQKDQVQNSRRFLKSKLLIEYRQFLKDYQGVCEATISIKRNDLCLFLEQFKKYACPSKIHLITPSKIHDYIIKSARTKSISARKSLSSSLRGFLRFLYVKGYMSKNLSNAVPVIVTPRLGSLPRGISWEDAKRLLKSPDRKTAVGRRNYAILQLILNYGVRINQATHILRKDIDWENGLIHFPQCKWNKALCFPLKTQVAKAIINYVKHDRSNAPFDEVFLSVIGKSKPLSYKYCLGTSFKSYYEKAGIKSNVYGAHAIRHAFATRLMEKKMPIKTIADLLGHRSIRSTFIYTKVDITRLRLLTCSWPGMEEKS